MLGGILFHPCKSVFIYTGVTIILGKCAVWYVFSFTKGPCYPMPGFFNRYKDLFRSEKLTCYVYVLLKHDFNTYTAPQKKWRKQTDGSKPTKLIALDLNKMRGKNIYCKICPKWWCKMVNYYSRVRKLTWQPLQNHQYLLGNTSSNGCVSSVMLVFRTKNQGCVQISCMSKSLRGTCHLIIGV